MARGIADLLTRMVMDSSQMTSGVANVNRSLGGIAGISRQAIRMGLGADLLDVTSRLGEAADKGEFLKDTVGRVGISLGLLGPLGLAAGGLIQAGLAIGGDGLDAKFAEIGLKIEALPDQARAALAEIGSGVTGGFNEGISGLKQIGASDIIDPALLSDLQGIQSQIAQALGFGGDKATVLGGLATAIRTGGGDVRAAAGEVTADILAEMSFSNAATLLANEGLDSIVAALEASPNRADAMAAATLLSTDLVAAFDVERQLDEALARAKPVLGANTRGEVMTTWRSDGAAAKAAWNEGWNSVATSTAGVWGNARAMFLRTGNDPFGP